MRHAHLTQIAVASTAAALCLGTAVPASAHSPGTGMTGIGMTGTAGTHSSAPTLAQVQAWVDSFIAERQQQSSTFATEVTADSSLTAARKSEIVARIAKQQAALTGLESAVDAATSVDGVHQAVRAAMAADGVRGFFGWCGFFGAHHHVGMHQPDGKNGTSPTQASRTVRQHTDPGRVKAPAGVRTVAVRTASHAPSPQPDRTAGRHRSDGSSWDGQYRSGGPALRR